MAKSPADRYSNASELLEDLELVQRGESPTYARPKVDLSSFAVQLGQGTAAPNQAPAGDGPASPVAAISLAVNVLLLIILIVVVIMFAT